MVRILEFSAYGILLHDESGLGWRSFVLFMVGVLFLVLLFDEMSRRAIKAIQRHRRSSFVSRLMRQNPEIIVKLRRFLSRFVARGVSHRRLAAADYATPTIWARRK